MLRRTKEKKTRDTFARQDWDVWSQPIYISTVTFHPSTPIGSRNVETAFRIHPTFVDFTVKSTAVYVLHGLEVREKHEFWG
jgi:hypothetical protein